jgi:hypothetical protein
VRNAHCFLAIVLVSASLAQPSFAKEAHARRATRPVPSAASARPQIRVPREVHVGPKGTGVGQGPVAKGADSIDTRPRDTIDAGVTAPPPLPGIGPGKARTATATFKLGVPGNSQVRHPAAAAAFNPDTRNAIAVPVGQHENLNGRDAAHFGSAALGPGGLAGPRVFGGPNLGPQHSAAFASAGVLNRGKIDGATLIRPALAPTGLGGPAKVVAGINGTSFRSKH